MNRLLVIDGCIDIALGVLLALYPDFVIRSLGIPVVEPPFYARILGAVLFGIGLALFIQIKNPSQGLGLGGAIAINMSGGICLGVVLLFTELSVPFHGQLIMWMLVSLLIVLSSIELVSLLRQKTYGPG